MRADTTTYDPNVGLNHDCVLVYPDGKYRVEHSYQRSDGGDPEIKVYIDTLPEADLKALQAALDDGKFQEITTPPPKGGIVKDMDSLSVRVPRPPRLQDINFVDSHERKPFDKALKPFLASLKSIEKRKVPLARDEKPNDCASPMMFYRRTETPAANSPTPPSKP
jgi:hypothetical protein